MILITDVIEYLRGKLIDMRVDGAGSLAAAQDDSRLMVEQNNSVLITTLFVTLGSFKTTVESQEALLQKYQEDIDIIVCIDNRRDRTGKAAQQLVYHLRLALLSALLNYREFDRDSHALVYSGDKMLDFDRVRYWHIFKFTCNGELAPEDGVALQNITNLNEYLADWNAPDWVDNPIAQDHLEHLYD